MKTFRNGASAMLLTLLFSLLSSFFVADAKPSVKKMRLPMKEQMELTNIARSYLLECGADAEIDLRVGTVCRNLVFMSDWRHLVFIMVARDPAAACLGNDRVLAFSMGATLARDANDRGIDSFLAYYDNTLQAMLDGCRTPLRDLPAEPQPRAVTALLKDIKWRQFHLRNQGDDIPQGSLTGCGPTAMAQLMTYWQHPSGIIDWQKVSRTCLWPNGDTTFITPLLVRLGRSIKADYGVKATSSSIQDIHDVLVREFDYSVRARLLFHDLTERDLLRAAYVDLRRGQPVVVCGCRHLFLCDGYYRGFYHLNMGWSGNFDGWYRLITPDAKVGQGSMLDGGIVGIEPCRESERQWFEVRSEQAGTLADKLNRSQLESIGKLRVSGPLNGRDIRLLRQMAGYVSPENLLSWHGALAELDLTDAQIVTDTVPYFEYDAERYRFWVSNGKKSYSFVGMKHQTWLEIKDFPYLHSKEIDVRELVPDSCYMVYVRTVADEVGQHFFSDCGNLREVRLPRSTKRISRYVLHGCPRLQRVWIPDSPQLKTIETSFPDGCSVEKY